MSSHLNEQLNAMVLDSFPPSNLNADEASRNSLLVMLKYGELSKARTVRGFHWRIQKAKGSKSLKSPQRLYAPHPPHQYSGSPTPLLLPPTEQRSRYPSSPSLFHQIISQAVPLLAPQSLGLESPTHHFCFQTFFLGNYISKASDMTEIILKAADKVIAEQLSIDQSGAFDM